jgi:Cu(I)/Ag(I) efflux system membrane fusion protein
MEGGVQVADVTVGTEGFEPAAVALRSGVPARLVFTRTTEDSCGTEVHSPTLGIEETRLPLGQAVPIEFTPGEAGRYTFACGMDMMEGAVVVRS